MPPILLVAVVIGVVVPVLPFTVNPSSEFVLVAKSVMLRNNFEPSDFQITAFDVFCVLPAVVHVLEIRELVPEVSRM